jgi:phage terminase small subunit
MRRLTKARMTPLQLRFIEEYVVDLNGKQAAIRAGYSPRSASRVASHMMRHQPQIVNAIDEALAARAARSLTSKDRILLEYARIAFADIRDIIEWGPGGVTLKNPRSLADAGAAAIAEISTVANRNGAQSRLRLHDKKKALDALVRLLGYHEKNRDAAAPPRREGEPSAREILLRRLEAIAEEEKEERATPGRAMPERGAE